MQAFADIAAARIAAVLEESPDTIRAQLVHPPKPEMGDLGFPCFPLAKAWKKAPPQIAAELAEKIETGAPFAEVKPVGPYLNFVIDSAALHRDVLDAIYTRPDAWGTSATGAGKTVVIDYSSPNIAKPLGVHHIRSTMLGAALSRLYHACGWEVITVNHLGDWGTTFGQLMVSYKKAEAENPDVPVDIKALLKLYVQYHADVAEDATLEDEARAWFKKLEDADAEATRLWRVFVDESLKSLRVLYDRLGVSFDYYTGESFFNDKMDAVAEQIANKGLLVESDGAQVVDLEAYDMPPCLIRKRDGATTYATRDLAAAIYRQDEYEFDRCLYVVANQQELHFRQVFKTLELAGFDWAGNCQHVKFGMLSFGPGVFGDDAATGSTRKGNVIYLEEVLDRAVERARAILEDGARDDEARAAIGITAEQVGVGAIVFMEFLQRRMKDVVFTWDKALNLQGDSGPYLQYTHARLRSVLRKYEGELPASIPWARLESPVEREVVMKLSEYPAVIAQTVREDEPSLLAAYLLELCAVFNRMFTDKERHRLLSDDADLTAARVGLVECVRRTLAGGLALLGLAAPERM